MASMAKAIDTNSKTPHSQCRREIQRGTIAAHRPPHRDNGEARREYEGDNEGEVSYFWDHG